MGTAGFRGNTPAVLPQWVERAPGFNKKEGLRFKLRYYAKSIVRNSLDQI